MPMLALTLVQSATCNTSRPLPLPRGAKRGHPPPASEPKTFHNPPKKAKVVRGPRAPSIPPEYAAVVKRVMPGFQVSG